MDEILDFETGGMLEIWAELLGITGKPEYRELMDRYTRRSLFDPLLEGSDPLSNMHANTTIPEILGAARAYEVTGETRWLDIAKAYWELAVERLPRSATGGGTTGEIWVPEGRLTASARRKEPGALHGLQHDAPRGVPPQAHGRGALRGLLGAEPAQRSPRAGLLEGKPDARSEGRPSPLRPRVLLPAPAPGSVKLWASETDHFFCCHGSNVQANATHTGGIFYKAGSGLAICQLVESTLSWDRGGEEIDGRDPPRRPRGGHPADRRRRARPSRPSRPPGLRDPRILPAAGRVPVSVSACRGGSRERPWCR